jgi:hypothetical protein
MKRTDCRTIVTTGVALLGLLATGAATAEERAENASCRQETRRVAVWPKGGPPKAPTKARFEDRQVTVCDGKVVSRAPESQASDSGLQAADGDHRDGNN